MGSTRRLILKKRVHSKSGDSKGLLHLRLSRQKRIAQIVARNVRLGPRIVLQQLSSAPTGEFERKLFEEYKDDYQKYSNNVVYHRLLAGLRARIHLLKVVNTLSTMLGGRKPTVYHLLAMKLLDRGLDSPELKRYAATLLSIYRKRRREVTWEGTPADVMIALRRIIPQTGKNFPVSIEKNLFDVGERGLTSRRIAETLGITFEGRNKDYINASLQLLNTAGLVQKLPHMSRPERTTVWSHAAFETPQIAYPNADIEILLAAQKDPVEYRSLFHPLGRASFSKIGDPNMPHQLSVVQKRLRQLTKAGLVEVYLVGSGRQTHKMVRLTESGKKLMDDYAREIELPAPWNKKVKRTPRLLLKVLLGEKEKNNLES